MKHIFTILLVIISLNTFAQRDRAQMREVIEAQKTAFITRQLDLSVSEAEKFWPIYNAFESEINAIKSKEIRPLKKELFNDSNISDEKANELLQQLINAENKIHEAKVGLIKDLKTILPAIKILKLKSAEDRFNKKLLERLKKMRANKKN